MSQIKIIADHREQAIIPFLIESARNMSQHSNTIIVEVATLGYGDYSIVRADTREYAIIERKTYADFASSLIDKRMDNIPSIVREVRERYAARDMRAYPTRVYLLLEGTVEYNPSEKIGGVTMRAIRAKINHLMQRDGIALITTRDAQDTANVLCEYARDMLTLREPSSAPTVGARAEVQPEQAPARSVIALEKRPDPTIADDVIAMFSAFPGIGPATARKIIAFKITVADFVTYSSKCPKTIERYVHRYLSERTYDCDVRALEGVWRVSHDIARALIAYARNVCTAQAQDDDEDGSLLQVCQLSREQLGAFTIKGRAHAAIGEHVYDCLHSVIIVPRE